jgi:ribosomal protein S18 acetylase RimI-like enzyme
MSGDDPAPVDDDFPAPPRDVTDAEGRTIHLREGVSEDREAVVSMYREFDPADRAQGIPPTEEERIREWLDRINSAGSLTILAEHEGDVVGHGMLVPDEQEGYELALFVLQEYQGAGIGTALLRTLLGLGRERGVERVWLSVERWNDPAITVYQKVGFEQTGSASFEIEMEMQLS